MSRLSFLNHRMNKTKVLVTGANRGIGLTLCKLLASRDNFTVILSSRNASEGQQQVNHLVNLGFDVHFLALDVSDLSSFSSKITTLIDNFGSIDILVNNAGVYLDSADLDEFPSFFELSEDILETTLSTNLFGPMLLSQLFSEYMNEGGLIINVSSGGGKINTSGDRSGHIAYRLSKTALNAFSKSFSNRLQVKNITIVSMCPGWVKTDLGGPNAPKSIKEGTEDILDLITNKDSLVSGSFYYNSFQQKL